MAQKDPLVEYRNEGSIMFEELIGAIHEEVVTLLFHAEVTPDDELQQQAAQNGGPLTYAHESLAGADAILAAGSSTAAIAGGGSVATPIQATKVNAEHENLGRNDPCWCGSGKKYAPPSRRYELGSAGNYRAGSVSSRRTTSPFAHPRAPGFSRKTSDGRILAREAAMTTIAAGTIAAVLLWAGLLGVDLAAHAYQRTPPRPTTGSCCGTTSWYAGRYSFVTYSFIYYPLAVVFFGIKALALATICAAGTRVHLARLARMGAGRPASSRTFAVLWAGIALSAAFLFALGVALALLGLTAMQLWPRPALRPGAADAAGEPACLPAPGGAAGRSRDLDPDPRPPLLLHRRRSSRSSVLFEVALYRIFPGSGRFPFGPWNLVPAVLFCVFGIVITRAMSRRSGRSAASSGSTSRSASAPTLFRRPRLERRTALRRRTADRAACRFAPPLAPCVADDHRRRALRRSERHPARLRLRAGLG